MRHNRRVLGSVLLALMLLLASGCGAKDEADTWLEKQEDKAKQQADQVARDIEDFFGGSGGGGCGATPLALSGVALTVVLNKKRTKDPGSGCA